MDKYLIIILKFVFKKINKVVIINYMDPHDMWIFVEIRVSKNIIKFIFKFKKKDYFNIYNKEILQNKSLSKGHLKF